MKLRRSVKIYLWIHVAALVSLALFPIYRAVAGNLSRYFGGCMIHDRLFLYCPLCGGTRAIEALLHLDFVSAWHCNAFVVLVAVAVLCLEVVAVVRLFRHCDRLLPIPQWSWIVFVVAMILYAVLRNYLMIAHSYDPLGDLLPFWQHVFLKAG